jgi:hypothetical protein
MELVGAPAEALRHPRRAERLGRAPGEGTSTLASTCASRATGELGGLLVEHPGWRAPLGRDIF